MSMQPKNSAVHWNCLLMSKNPLDVLKKGLSKLKNSVKERRDHLLAFLNRKEKISDEDEEWLDNAGNVVDEEAVVDLLENASDYEHGLIRLTSQQKSLVEKLKELGGKGNKLLGVKRKSMCNTLTHFRMKAKFSEKDLTNANKSLKKRSRKPSRHTLKRKTRRLRSVLKS